MRFLVSLLLASFLVPNAFAQGGPPGVPTQLQTQQLTLLPQNPVAPVTNVTATPSIQGSTSYFYWFVSYVGGVASAPAGPFLVNNAPATLGGINTVTLKWTPAPGATAYDVLRTTSSAVPSGACGCAIATAVALTTLTDNSATTSAYTVNTPASQIPLVLTNLNSGVPVPAAPSAAFLAPLQGLVQSAVANNGSSGAIPAVAMNSNVVGGDLLLACELGHIDATATIGVTDTQVNTWTALPFAGTTGAGGTSEIQCFYAVARSSAADSMQITMSGPAVFDLNLIFAEYAGVTTLDQNISASATSSGNITTTHNNEMLITFAVTANTGIGVLPLSIGPNGSTEAQRVRIQNTDTVQTPVAAMLEDAPALMSGIYSSSFNQGGTATNPTIQLLSFYSSSPLVTSIRPISWSDLPNQPLNQNCTNTFPCQTMQFNNGSAVSVAVYGPATFGSNSTCLYMPMGCFTIPVINSGDDDFLWGISTGGPSTRCAFGARMDGDGFYVLGGVPAPNQNCSLALVEPNITSFGGFVTQDNQDTTHADLQIGPSSAKTAGAPLVNGKDSAGTTWLNVPDLETKNNPPQFPLGLTSGGFTATGTQTISGCSLTVPLGGAWAGSFKSGTTGTCTITITPGTTATNGFFCIAKDLTTPADEPKQTAYTTTTCTLSWTTVSGDLITWQAVAF